MLISTGISIDGNDITPAIAFNGVKWSRNDVDGPNAGRNMAGTMISYRVATKIRLDITCRPLKHDELVWLMNLLLPEFVSVTYDDPIYGVVTKTMYANNHSAQIFKRYENNEEVWFNVSFPLVER